MAAVNHVDFFPPELKHNYYILYRLKWRWVFYRCDLNNVAILTLEDLAYSSQRSNREFQAVLSFVLKKNG